MKWRNGKIMLTPLNQFLGNGTCGYTYLQYFSLRLVWHPTQWQYELNSGGNLVPEVAKRILLPTER